MATTHALPVTDIAKETWQAVREDDLTGLAGEVAYNVLLALFPALIFIAALAGFIGAAVGVDDLFEQVLAYLGGVMPPSAVETITTPLRQVLATQSGGLLSLGILGTLWAASNATAVMMKAFNREYAVKETRPFWQHRLLIAVGLTLLLAVLVLAAFLLFVFGEQLGRWVAGFIGADALFVTVWSLLRWPVIVLAIVLGGVLLYWAGPNVRPSFRWIWPGVVLATLLWLLFTWLFQVYIANFNSYDRTYGTIAGVIILLLWLNYSSLVFLVGMELNQVLQRRYDRRMLGDLSSHPEKQTQAGRQEVLGAARPRTTAEEGRDSTTARPGHRVGRPADPVRAHGPRAVPTAPAARRGADVPTWLNLAALGVWTVAIVVGALRRGGRDHA